MASLFALLVATLLFQTHCGWPLYEVALPDPARPGRTVTAKLCLPDSQIAEIVPLLIYGHGFDCNPQDYAYYCNFAATAMVYNTSNSSQPYNPGYDADTRNLAIDAAFLAKELRNQASTNTSSPLFGRVAKKTMLGGHSMGGGTTLLAAGFVTPAPPVDGLYLNAPGLYTDPVAVPYLGNITVPSIIISGSDDCGPNALPNQPLPAFLGLASKRKYLMVLKGANHCGWTRTTEPLGHGFVCADMDECGHISKETQHELGIVVASAFSSALSTGKWDVFDAFLAQGEKNGTWTYTDGIANKTLHNNCPCTKGSQMSISV